MSARLFRKTWHIDLRHGGKRYRIKSPYNSRSSALEYEAFIRQSLSRGDDSCLKPAPKPHTLSSFVPIWLRVYVDKKNKPSEQHTKRYILNGHLLPWFGDLPLDAITPWKVQEYQAAKLEAGLAAKTINNHLLVLSKCLHSAEDGDLIRKCPKLDALPLEPPPFDYLVPEESRLLLTDTEEPLWNAMIRVALRTGMRRGELFGVQIPFCTEFSRGCRMT